MNWLWHKTPASVTQSQGGDTMPWLLQQHSMMRQGSNTSCYILNHLHTIWPKHRSLVKYLIHLLRKTSGTRLGSATEKNAIRCSILFWWCNLLPLYNSEDQRISGKWSHVFLCGVWPWQIVSCFRKLKLTSTSPHCHLLLLLFVQICWTICCAKLGH